MYNVQMYTVQMYSVQMHNVQMYIVQMYNVQMHSVQRFKSLIVLELSFFYTKLIEIENDGEKHLRINSRPSRLPSGAHFPSVLMIFKTAVAFKVFLLGISIFSKICWKLNSTAK